MRVSVLGEVSHYDPSVNLKLSCALSIACFMQLRFPSKTKEDNCYRFHFTGEERRGSETK